MDRLESILDRLPHYYNKGETSQIYNVLKAFADEFDIVYSDYISRADNNIGIGTTDGRDLDWRFGNLINVKRQQSESDQTYRRRLMSVINSLHGGTADSIHYTVSIFLGLADDNERSDRCIEIYDGWDYQNPLSPDMTEHGNIICALRFDPDDRHLYYDGIEDDIVNATLDTKAAGTVLHVIVEFTRYNELVTYTHQQLSAYTNKQIRDWGTE